MECSIRYALSKRNDDGKCIPWFYPAVDPNVRMCDPFETREFNAEIERMRGSQCKVISKFDLVES